MSHWARYDNQDGDDEEEDDDEEADEGRVSLEDEAGEYEGRGLVKTTRTKWTRSTKANYEDDEDHEKHCE